MSNVYLVILIGVVLLYFILRYFRILSDLLFYCNTFLDWPKYLGVVWQLLYVVIGSKTWLYLRQLLKRNYKSFGRSNPITIINAQTAILLVRT